MTLTSKILEANERCSRYMADANEALESGNKEKADKLFEKSQFWRDRYNKLVGDA